MEIDSAKCGKHLRRHVVTCHHLLEEKSCTLCVTNAQPTHLATWLQWRSTWDMICSPRCIHMAGLRLGVHGQEGQICDIRDYTKMMQKITKTKKKKTDEIRLNISGRDCRMSCPILVDFVVLNFYTFIQECLLFSGSLEIPFLRTLLL